MKTPPAEITSGCWPGKPTWPLPAEKTTVIPAVTAAAIAAARAWSAALKVVLVPVLLPQLQVMIFGLNPAAALKAPVELTKLIFTGSNSTSGATAKILDDSPVP